MNLSKKEREVVRLVLLAAIRDGGEGPLSDCDANGENIEVPELMAAARLALSKVSK